MTDLSRLEPKNGDFVRYVDDLIRRQQAEMLRTRGDEAAAMRASLRDAFDAMEATDRDGDGVSLKDLVGALAGKTAKAARAANAARKHASQPAAPGSLQTKRSQKASARKSGALPKIVFIERFAAIAAILGAVFMSELGLTLPGTPVAAADFLIAIAILLFIHSGILEKRG